MEEPVESAEEPLETAEEPVPNSRTMDQRTGRHEGGAIIMVVETGDDEGVRDFCLGGGAFETTPATGSEVSRKGKTMTTALQGDDSMLANDAVVSRGVVDASSSSSSGSSSSSSSSSSRIEDDGFGDFEDHDGVRAAGGAEVLVGTPVVSRCAGAGGGGAAKAVLEDNAVDTAEPAVFDNAVDTAEPAVFDNAVDTAEPADGGFGNAGGGGGGGGDHPVPDSSGATTDPLRGSDEGTTVQDVAIVASGEGRDLASGTPLAGHEGVLVAKTLNS